MVAFASLRSPQQGLDQRRQWRLFVDVFLRADPALHECLRLTIEESQHYRHAQESFRRGAPMIVVRGLLLKALMEALL